MTLLSPERRSVYDAEETWRQFQQLVGMLTGQDNWGAQISHTSYDSDTTFAHTIDNQGTGGHLHIPDEVQVRSDGSGTTIRLLTVDSMVIQDLIVNGSTTLGNAAADALTVNATSTFNARTTTAINATGVVAATFWNGFSGANGFGLGILNAPGDAFDVLVSHTAATFAIGISGTTAAFSTSVSTGTLSVTTTSTLAAASATTLSSSGAATLNSLGVTNGATVGGTLGVTGAITGSSTVQGTRLISTVSTGTAPLTVLSTTLVGSLNADLLDGFHASAFATTGDLANYLPLAGGTLTGQLTMEIGGGGNTQAIKLKHNAGAGGFWIGASNAADPSFVFADNSGDEMARVNPSGSTYALDVNNGTPATNAARFTGDVLIVDDLGVNNINATGSGAFTGGLSAGASSAFTGGVSVITGGLSVLGGAITSHAVSGTPAANALYTNNTPKGWAYVDTAGNVNAGFNVSSVTDHGTGDWSINWDRDFSSSSYCAVASAKSNSAHIATIADSSFAAGVTRVRVFNTAGAAADPNQFMCMAMGVQ